MPDQQVTARNDARYRFGCQLVEEGPETRFQFWRSAEPVTNDAWPGDDGALWPAEMLGPPIPGDQIFDLWQAVGKVLGMIGQPCARVD